MKYKYHTDLFQVINPGKTCPTWAKTKDGRETPIVELWLKSVRKDAPVDSLICTVWGIDANKVYEPGDIVLATIEIFIGQSENGFETQITRASNINKIELQKESNTPS